MQTFKLVLYLWLYLASFVVLIMHHFIKCLQRCLFSTWQAYFSDKDLEQLDLISLEFTR